MTGSGLFWFVLGAMSAVAAVLVALPALRAVTQAGAGRGRAAAVLAVSVVAVGALSLLLYQRFGRPDLAASTATVAPAADAAVPQAGPAPRAGAAAAANGQVESIDAAATKLAQRLAKGGGSEADWTLLAQSYEFMSRPADAALAREHKLPAGVAMGPEAGAPGAGVASLAQRASAELTDLEARVKRDPRDGKSWLALAETQRLARDFPASRAAFEKAAALGAMTADGWADYADLLAAVTGGSLAGPPAQAIGRALALDARHPKALWLDASLAVEQHRYPDAAAKWRRLRAVLPAESPDVKIVDSNIAEAEALAAGREPPSAPMMQAAAAPLAPAQAASVRVTGTVQLAPALLSKVTRGMTLYIYAKSPDSPGPPLAVMRTQVDRWPVSFALDDSMAMMPARRISGFDTVVIEARISRSGNAIAAAGDLIATSAAIRPREGRPVALTIAREMT